MLTRQSTGNLLIESLLCMRLIHAAGLTHGKSMKSYLIMMGLRMLEMRRVSKEYRVVSIYIAIRAASPIILKLVDGLQYLARNNVPQRNHMEVGQMHTARP